VFCKLVGAVDDFVQQSVFLMEAEKVVTEHFRSADAAAAAAAALIIKGSISKM